MVIYQHYKGGLYRIVCHAFLESTNEEMVVYFSTDNYKHWIRPIKEFNEKFTAVEASIRGKEEV